MVGLFQLTSPCYNPPTNPLTRTRYTYIKNFVLLTGDKKEIGEKVGNEVGFDEIIAECIPQDKLNYIKEK